VAEHRLDEDEAREIVVALAYDLPKRAYKLDAPPVGRPSRSKAA
jgi:glucuronate isomerase